MTNVRGGQADNVGGRTGYRQDPYRARVGHLRPAARCANTLGSLSRGRGNAPILALGTGDSFLCSGQTQPAAPGAPVKADEEYLLYGLDLLGYLGDLCDGILSISSAWLLLATRLAICRRFPDLAGTGFG